MKTRWVNSIFVTLALVVLSGCATAPPDPSAMIPAWDVPETPISNANLFVTDVTGGAEPDSQSMKMVPTYLLTDDEFKQALVEALRHSNIFENVFTGTVNETAYKLQAKIISQPAVGPGFDMDVTLFVRYTLTDFAGNEVWADNIFSEHFTKFAEAGDGGKRMVLTREGVVRANFAILLDKLSSVMRSEQES